MSVRLEVVRTREQMLQQKIMIGPKEMMEMLSPWMSPPTELSENELRLVMAMIQPEVCERSIDGLLKLGLRHKFMLELSECDEKRLKQLLKRHDRAASLSAQESRSRPQTKSKKKGRASKTKGSSSAADNAQSELPASLSVDYGIGADANKGPVEHKDNKELPPIRFSSSFIQYIRQPEGKKLLKKIEDDVWEASNAYWDYDKVSELRASTFTFKGTRTVSEGLETMQETARRAGTQAGIRAGVEAALLAQQMAQGPIEGTNSWEVKPIKTVSLDDESRVRARVQSIKAGSSLARPCSSLSVPLPEDAGPTLTKYRKKILFEVSVRGAKYHMKQLLEEAKGEGKPSTVTESKTTNVKPAPVESGGASGSQNQLRRSEASGSKFSFAKETAGQKGPEIQRTTAGGWAFDASRKLAATAKSEGKAMGESSGARVLEFARPEDRQRNSSGRAAEPGKGRVPEIPRPASRSSSTLSRQSRSSDGSGSDNGKARVVVAPRKAPGSSGSEQSSGHGHVAGRVLEVPRPQRPVLSEAEGRVAGRLGYPDPSQFEPVLLGGGLREVLD